MANDSTVQVNNSDRQTLRELATRVREIAHDPIMEERRRLWYKHAAGQGERPMILAETGGVLDELIPVSVLKCKEDWARGMERGFLNTIFMHERVKDDSVVEPFINCNWNVKISDYGVTAKVQRGDNAGKLGSYRWDPPITNLRTDLDKLHFRTYSVDRDATMKWKSTLEEVCGDILQVRIRGGFWWTVGMTWTAINLIGLEGLMLFMYDDPEGLHRLMAFLRDDHFRMLDWFEKEGLLSLNNRNDYIGSGGTGYTHELPAADHKDGQPVRIKDLWGLSESQETVGVSPEMFAEFIFPYQLPVIERFGLAYYGCCEPVHSRWNSLKKIPNLRRVSVSPWCNQEIMAEACGRKYAFCRKPNPALISSEMFDEDLLRDDLRQTVRIARNCNVELAMKDVHTVSNQPDRLGRWVQLAREAIGEMT